MPTHIRFRLNKLTGEVEEFLVDDQDRTLPEAEHDRIATEVARVITRHPQLQEVSGPVLPPTSPPEPETEPEREQQQNDQPQREGEA